MREDERNSISFLLNNDKCVDSSSGYIIGNKVIITEGALVGLKSYIKKIDRHKNRAILEMELMGAKHLVTVALNIFEIK